MAKIKFKPASYEGLSFNEENERQAFIDYLDKTIKENHCRSSALHYASIVKRKLNCILNLNKKLHLKSRDSAILDELKRTYKSIKPYKFYPLWYNNTDKLYTKKDRLMAADRWNKLEDEFEKYLLQGSTSKELIRDIHKYNVQYIIKDK